MAKVLGTDLGNRVDQKQATQPVVLVDIYWGFGGFSTYADKDYLFNSNNEPQIEGRILNITGLDSTVKLNGSNSSSISLTLDDHDNKLRDTINNNNVNLISRKVVIRHAYDDLDNQATNTIVLFVGQITTPITWGNRTLSFTVLSKLEDKEVGFSAEQGQFDFINDDAVGKTWPLVVGAAKFVPGIKINNRTVGYAMSEYSIISLKEYKNFRELVQEYVKIKRTKEKMDDDRVDENKRKIWCSDDEYKEVFDKFVSKWSELLNYYNNLISQKPESVDTLKSLFDALIEYWDKFEFNLQCVAEINEIQSILRKEFSEFQEADRPLSGSNAVIWQQKKQEYLNRSNVLQAQLVINQQIITEQETLIGDLSIELQEFGLTSLKVLNGKKFPQGTNVDILINGLKIRGVFTNDTFAVGDLLPTYSDIEFGTRETDDPNIFWLDDSSIYLKHQFIFIKKQNEPSRLAYVKDQNGNKCTLYQMLVKKIAENPIKYEPILLDDTYQIYQTSAASLNAWFSLDDNNPNFISLKKDRMETGTSFMYEDDLDIDYEIKMGDEVFKASDYFDTYIVNCVPLSHTASTSVNEVCAYRTINGEKRLVPIPKKYYRKRQNEILDQLKVTAIEMIRPLTDHKGENWESDIYVSISGGVFGNSNYDAIDLLIFFITKYSTLSYDSTSFTATRVHVANMIPNFLLDERRNVIDLIEEIAWQCKCVVWVQNDIVFIRSIAHQGADTVSLTESDILDREVTYTDDSDIVTVFEIVYKKWYLPNSERKIVLRNNVPIFGKRKREFNFFIFTDEVLIEHIATFWLLRYSNIWKKVKFTTPIHTIRLDVYDQVGITLTDGIIKADNSEFHAMVESTVYNSERCEISYECWTPIRMQDGGQYLWAYTADQVQLYPYPFPGIDNYPGGSSFGYNITSGGNFIYTTRPKDYGTQYPADFSITVPISQPTIGEVDYTVLKKKGLFRKLVPVQLDIDTEVFDNRNGAKGKLSQLLKVVRSSPGRLACELKQVSSMDDIPFRHQKSYLVLDHDKPIHSAKIWQPNDNYLDDISDERHRKLATLPLEQYHEIITSQPKKLNTINLTELWTANNDSDTLTTKGTLFLSNSVQDRSDVFLARILAQESGPVNRLEYDWEEVVLRRLPADGSPFHVVTKFEGRNSTTHGKAVNLIEIFDEFRHVAPTYDYLGNGIKRLRFNLPPFTSITLQPPGGGAAAHTIGEAGAPVIVVMYRMPTFQFVDDSSLPDLWERTKYVFQYENGVDGPCPA